MHARLIAVALVLFLMTPAAADHRGAHWTPPSTNANGTPLTDLAGYRVYVCMPAPARCDRQNATLHATVAAPASRGPLPSSEGLWFVTAFDTWGNESGEPAAAPFDFVAPSAPTDLSVR